MIAGGWIADRFRTSVQKEGSEIGCGGSGINAASGGMTPYQGFKSAAL